MRPGTKAYAEIERLYGQALTEYPGLDLRLASIGAAMNRFRAENGYTDAARVLDPLKVEVLAERGEFYIPKCDGGRDAFDLDGSIAHETPPSPPDLGE